MPEDGTVFPPGAGPAWGLTPKGRRRARQALAAVVLALLAAGCLVDRIVIWVAGRLVR